MNWNSIKATVLAFLGVKAFSKDKDGKEILTKEQKTALEKLMNPDTIAALEKHLAENANAGVEQQNKDLVEAQQKLESLNAEKDSLVKEKAILEGEKTTLASEKADLQKKIDENEKLIASQKEMIQKMSGKPETDPPAQGKGAEGKQELNPMDDKFLFGVQQPFMAIDNKRPYNKRAYAKIMANRGYESPMVPKASSMDYQSLKDDLGDYYRIRQQEGLQSFLMKLPSIETLFKMNSGYQDRAVLVNVFLTEEFSQAWNTGSDFDNMVKGGYKFEPEELTMFDVTFAHKFSQLEELEKAWIGYLNKEGSDVMKWSFIEYILVETGKKLHNERELRRVGGKRINPTVNVPGTAMGAADGFYEFIRKKVANFQIKEFSNGTPTSSNIANYVYEMTGMIPAHIRDTGMLILYMPQKDVTLYHKNLESLYGTNQDYKANIMYVKEYPNVKIEAVPNSENFGRFVWTIDGNIQLFEDVPGEMYKFSLEQEDWKLKVWSRWKESTWAWMVGKKYDSAAEQTYDNQMIFCNDIHYSPDYYLAMAANDTTPSVALHTNLVSVANTQATAITNIDDAVVGQHVTIKCGNTTNAITIAKAGNFSLITAAWTPALGDEIVLMKRSDGKFIEISRTDVTNTAIAFDADDVTPSVAAGTSFITVANTQATAITNFDDATEDVIYTIYGGSDADSSTIADGGNFSLTAAMTLEDGTYIKLIKASDGKFYEIERG